MTREAIERLPAGERMNIEVGKLLGYAKIRQAWRMDFPGHMDLDDEPSEGRELVIIYDDPKTGEELLPNFSGYIGAAWKALEKIRGEKDAVRVFIDSLENGEWCVHLEPRNKIETYTAEEMTLPLAICRAALLFYVA